MAKETLKVLLVDEGMNTGDGSASKIGGGQLARRRLLSDKRLFNVTLLSSEQEVIGLWKDRAETMHEEKLEIYRPVRTDIALLKLDWTKFIFHNLKAACVLRKYLISRDWDIVLLNDNKSRFLYLVCLLVSPLRKYRFKVAITIDGEWNLGLTDTLMKILYLFFFDKIVCPSQTVRKRLGWIGKLKEKKLLTAYSGMNIPAFRKRLYQAEDADDRVVKMACIGTLRTEIKGQDLIVRAVAHLVKKNGTLPFKIFFFGDGPDKPVLMNMIKRSGVEEYFEFKGFVADKFQIYNQADLCIVASRTEAAPSILLESFIRDIPVIASDLEACKEISSLFHNDLLFGKNDHEDLARLIKKCLCRDVLKNVQRKIANVNKQVISREYQVRRIHEFFSK